MTLHLPVQRIHISDDQIGNKAHGIGMPCPAVGADDGHRLIVRLLLLEKTGIPDRSSGYDKYNFLHENILTVLSHLWEFSFPIQKGAFFLFPGMAPSESITI
jgi:hypothetical protein